MAKKKTSTSMTPPPKFTMSKKFGIDFEYLVVEDKSPKKLVSDVIFDSGSGTNLGSRAACDKIAVDVLAVVATNINLPNVKLIEQMIEFATANIEQYSPPNITDEWFKLYDKYWKLKENKK